MKTYTATVLGRRPLSAHLVTVTLGGLTDYPTTGIPDEYLRVLIPPVGVPLALPEIDEKWTITYSDGAIEPDFRVYTISDHRLVDGVMQLDLDIALHDEGVGSDWVRRCQKGDEVGLIEPHGLYAAPADVAWQLLVADITGLPALARILRGLSEGQRAVAHIVITDPLDEIPLPSAADVEITWQVVAKDTDICEALTEAVTSRDLPGSTESRPDGGGNRYVWLAGEARSSRAVRKHLRRELKWPQADFYTCGYWQIEAEKWNARYEEVAEEVVKLSAEMQQTTGGDQGAYLDALDDIYESVGL